LPPLQMEHMLNRIFVYLERGNILKRGAFAPLRHPVFTLLYQFSPLCQRRGELKRKGQSPPPLLDTSIAEKIKLSSPFGKGGVRGGF
jgi:hypothetical protein